ncbi:MAG: DEAD/DEAH box helicase family protein [Nitrospirota bacterium]
MFELKDYQKKSIAALDNYLTIARIKGPEQAFNECLSSEDSGAALPSYKKMEGLEEIPYVCLRLPTGGGKTVLASFSIATAGRSYLEQDYPLVLWLVPTNTIREQTLELLRNPDHPCRTAVDDAFEGRVSVFDISEIENIRPHDLTGKVCIVVGTLATLRVNNTDGRKIYSHKESFEPHFTRIQHSIPGLERIEEGDAEGKIKFSFANLMHVHRPLVIMDEAHNARTTLTFEVMQRISPACIIEFTATPDNNRKTGSNVLYRVSAAELKVEDMIKLPIILTEHNNWQETLRDTVLTRTKLEKKAVDDKDFIRPIALIQAESKDRELTVEFVRQHLIENEKIDRDRIAIATGKQHDLDNINLFDPKCKVEYVITIQALKEGWDCSFAYVFCSVANIRSTKDVEQLLGRVLRMPYAKKRNDSELNKAYAHISSPDFAHAAKQLHDCLVDMGFEHEEIDAFLEAGQPSFIDDEDLPLYNQKPIEPLSFILEESPDFTNMSGTDKEKIDISEDESGEIKVTVKGNITDDLEDKIINAVPKTSKKEVKQLIRIHRIYQQKTLSPSQRGEKLTVPCLCIWIQGELELAEKELFLDEAGWNLLDYPAELSAAEFSVNETARTFEVDLKGNKIVYGLIDSSRQLDLTDLPTTWTPLELSRWMDKQVHQPDIRQEVMLEFLRRTLTCLIEKRNLEIAILARCKYPIIKLLLEKVKSYRQQAYDKGYQETLFGPKAAVETSYEFGITYDPDTYSPKWPYRGSYRFQKHFYPYPGEMKSDGEEFECAKILDSLSQVKYWVRNIDSSQFSFKLPTSKYNFYPDFIAELHDGRIFVVEYKGAHLIDKKEEKEKRNIGELWEEKSKGKGLFLMAEKKDKSGRDVYKQLVDKIGK